MSANAFQTDFGLDLNLSPDERIAFDSLRAAGLFAAQEKDLVGANSLLKLCCGFLYV